MSEERQRKLKGSWLMTVAVLNVVSLIGSVPLMFYVAVQADNSWAYFLWSSCSVAGAMQLLLFALFTRTIGWDEEPRRCNESLEHRQ